MSSRFSFIQTNILPGFLLTLMIIEVSLHTVIRNLFGPYTSPIVLMGISLLVAVVYFFLFFNASEPEQPVEGRIRVQLSEHKDLRWVWLIFLAGVIVNVFVVNKAFQRLPIDIQYSDIVPVTMRYVENFISGNTVYTTMQFDGFERYPKYFPLRWLPFVVFQHQM